MMPVITCGGTRAAMHCSKKSIRKYGRERGALQHSSACASTPGCAAAACCAPDWPRPMSCTNRADFKLYPSKRTGNVIICGCLLIEKPRNPSTDRKVLAFVLSVKGAKLGAHGSFHSGSGKYHQHLVTNATSPDRRLQPAYPNIKPICQKQIHQPGQLRGGLPGAAARSRRRPRDGRPGVQTRLHALENTALTPRALQRRPAWRCRCALPERRRRKIYTDPTTLG